MGSNLTNSKTRDEKQFRAIILISEVAQYRISYAYMQDTVYTYIYDVAQYILCFSFRLSASPAWGLQPPALSLALEGCFPTFVFST